MAKSYHDYLKNVYETYISGDATEPSYYPLLKELLESLGKKLGMVGGVTVQPKRTKAGIPDFLLKTKAGKIVGYVEAKYPVVGTDRVEKREYQEKTGRVLINAQQYFEGILKQVWEYRIGSYQVLDKWLKERKGRSLSLEDVEHYLKVITAIKHTINLQQEIDTLYPDIEESSIGLRG